MSVCVHMCVRVCVCVFGDEKPPDGLRPPAERVQWAVSLR